MSSQYTVCALFWEHSGHCYYLKNQGRLEDLLNDGWEISRVDAMSPTNFPAGAFGATNVYVLEKQSEEKQSEDTKKSSVSGFLPHDMGLRVALDDGGAYYLKSGWKERWDGIYGLACGYEDYGGCVTWFEDPGRIAIMNSHVKLAVPFEDETTKQSEDTK